MEGAKRAGASWEGEGRGPVCATTCLEGGRVLPDGESVRVPSATPPAEKVSKRLGNGQGKGAQNAAGGHGEGAYSTTGTGPMCLPHAAGRTWNFSFSHHPRPTDIWHRHVAVTQQHGLLPYVTKIPATGTPERQNMSAASEL